MEYCRKLFTKIDLHRLRNLHFLLAFWSCSDVLLDSVGETWPLNRTNPVRYQYLRDSPLLGETPLPWDADCDWAHGCYDVGCCYDDGVHGDHGVHCGDCGVVLRQEEAQGSAEQRSCSMNSQAILEYRWTTPDAMRLICLTFASSQLSRFTLWHAGF